MKLKKFVTMFVMTMLAILLTSSINVSKATSGSKYLGIKMLREEGYAYQALEKNIWKIVEAQDINGNGANYDNVIYCLKGGPGFGDEFGGSGTPVFRHYTQYFDMKNPSSIPSQYQSALPAVNSDKYRALMWVLNHIYVKPKATASTEVKQEAEAYKQSLLQAAGIDYIDLTEDDIDVVQQLAIWHFTNEGDSFDVGDSQTFTLYLSTLEDDLSSSAFVELGDIGENGAYRAEQAIQLYQYLVNTAETNASNYDYSETASTPYELDKTRAQTVVEENGKYKIGPFKINQISNTEATLNGTFQNGLGETLNPTLQNESGSRTFNSLKETVGEDFYLVLPNTTNIDTITFSINGSYAKTNIQYWSVEGAPTQDQPVAIIERVQESFNDSTTFVKPEEEIFDLALRKFIVSINGEPVDVDRTPQIGSGTLDDLADGSITTAEKLHPKNPLVVNTGDTIVYAIRVYNEGNVDARVTKISDYLPEGLELTSNSMNSIWTEPRVTSIDRSVYTNSLAGQTIPAFDGETLHYLEVQMECRVTATVQEDDIDLKNVAEITGAEDNEGNDKTDRDSTPENLTSSEIENYNPRTSERGWGYEDDDDYEELVIPGKYFDLSLRKFITSIDGEEIMDSSRNYIREPDVDTSNLLEEGETTAIYNHPKNTLGVKVGDEIIYTIRVYNEGQLDGYVTEITDYLPDGLEFVSDSFNTDRGWTLEGNGRIAKTTILSDEKLTAFSGTSLDYAEVQIKCRVTDTVQPGQKLTNIAEISEFTDENKSLVTDRDSQAGNVTLPNDSTLPNYKDNEINRGDEYIPGQQDDDDFEKVVVEKFDLALRKFITGVNADTITNREPVFNNNNGDYTYVHTKDPVGVKSGDTVIYTLRVYNEGDISGYAEEIKDDIPEGLEFLPDNTTNINYRWKMYDVNGDETQDVSQAVTIKTDYLSKAQEEETRRNNLIQGFDPDTMDEPAYKEVRVAFRVTEPDSSDKIIINTAEISEDSDEDGEPIDDIDSTPDNDNDEEDDIDIEKVILEEFDLALRKFITAITSGGETTQIDNRAPQITQEQMNSLVNGDIETLEKTHTKEPIQVKPGDRVVYTIRIYNEGEVAGYAAEITDYLPEGLRFAENSSINSQYGWTNPNGDGRTIVTTALSDDLIYAADEVDGQGQVRFIDVQIECEVVAEYESTEVSLKNVAEITKDLDENRNEVDDRDSTPDNLTDEEKNNYNPGTSEKGWGYEDDDDYEELVIHSATGDFELKLIKVNGLGNKLSGATFKVEELNSAGDVINTYEGLTTNESGEVVTDRIAVSGEGTYTFVITEENAPDGYEILAEPIRLEVTISLVNGVYTVTDAKASRTEEGVSQSNLQDQNYDSEETLTTTINLESNNLNVEENAQSVSIENGAVKSVEVNDNTIEITIENTYFDLALRKFITTINGNPVSTNGNPAVDRTPVVSDETKQDLFDRTTTTASKTHTKTPLQVNTGDTVVYTIRIYNEGEVAGYAAEITDYLPEGLRLKENSNINSQYGWTNPSGDGRTIVTTALEDELINAFDGTILAYKDVQIECEVVATKGENDTSLKNVAEITKDLDKDKNEVVDRDSVPNNLEDDQKNNYNPGTSEQGWGYEDDDDYEELVLPAATGEFKIKLIKQNGLGNRLQNAIFKVEEVGDDDSVIETYDDLTTNENGEILIENLQITEPGNRTFVITETQAPDGYTLLDEPIRINVHISLENGEYVISAEQVDNAQGLQTVSNLAENTQEEIEDDSIDLARTKEILATRALSNNLDNVKKLADASILDEGVIDAEENTITNSKVDEKVDIIAEETDIETKETKDKIDTKIATVRQTNLVSSNFLAEEIGGVQGEQLENSSVKNIAINGNTVEITIENTYFDLSLRKFITGVNDKAITNRVPVFSSENGEYTYTHPKDPVEVANGDVVIYTIRVYNEGETAGYAEEVKDDLPEGLEFLPDNSVNTEYRWVMYDANGEVTENANEAVSIRTDYLSKAQEEETGRDNLLEAFDPDTMTQPDYRDVQIAFRVTEPNTSDRVLINIAEISEDSDEDGEPVEDIDSTPDNDEEGEDDIDEEQVKVTYFDLALKKIISKVTMTLDGETTVEETGHDFDVVPEPPVKIELGNHKINDAVIKFTYQIRITNEGNKAGYAYEIKDYIPEGLEFIEEDNEGWVLSEDGETITTDQLAETLLEPGDSVVIEVTFRWINGHNNLGVKTNWAEISEDSDDDIDSTPDNFEKGEDDIDDAEVVLSIVTGIGEYYIGVITAVLAILAGGIILIRKFV